MDNIIQLTPHEALEFHEILRSEVTAAKKLQASTALVTDQDLKALMELSLQTKRSTLDGYQTFYTKSVQLQ